MELLAAPLEVLASQSQDLLQRGTSVHKVHLGQLRHRELGSDVKLVHEAFQLLGYVRHQDSNMPLGVSYHSPRLTQSSSHNLSHLHTTLLTSYSSHSIPHTSTLLLTITLKFSPSHPTPHPPTSLLTLHPHPTPHPPTPLLILIPHSPSHPTHPLIPLLALTPHSSPSHPTPHPHTPLLNPPTHPS